MLTIVGGTYLEICTDPLWYELFGSGLRGAIAIANSVHDIKFVSCIGEEKLKSANIICSTFNIIPFFLPIKKTISFQYYHPLSKPIISNNYETEVLYTLEASNECVLIYGQLEAKARVKANYAVYDPQNGEPFDRNESQVEHLALVLNKQEAHLFSTLEIKDSIINVGHNLLDTQNADVVVIKNGSEGAWVFDRDGYYQVPAFETNSVFPIGSGDVFSAVFTREWAVRRRHPADAAHEASLSTAEYCSNKLLPLPERLGKYQSISSNYEKRKKIYIAAPFFSISERWIINEVRRLLLEFNNEVFSPYHDVGFGEPKEVAFKDLSALEKSDIVFAILDGLDSGTIFEVGYAKALNKKVLIFVEKINFEDLTMFLGTDCQITNDLSTAIYKASWLM